MKSIIFCVTVCCILSVAFAQRFAVQSCPSNIAAITNFDVPRYLGLWYELLRYEQPFQRDGECVQAEYSLNLDESIHVHNSMTKPPSKERETIDGRAILSYPGATPIEAKLNVTFGPDMPPIFSNYWVIDTDYDNYSLVYSCLSVGEMSAESAWLLSRTPVLNQDVESHVNEAVDKYFVRSALRVTKQDAELCQY